MLAASVQSDTRRLWEALVVAPGHPMTHWRIMVAAADLEGDAQVQPRSIVVRHHHPDAACRLARHLAVPDGDDARLRGRKPPKHTCLRGKHSRGAATIHAFWRTPRATTG